METFRVVCQNLIDKYWIINIFEAGGFLNQILKIVRRTKFFQIMISHFSIKVAYNNHPKVNRITVTLKLPITLWVADLV